MLWRKLARENARTPLLACLLVLTAACPSQAQIRTLPDAFAEDQLLWELDLGIHQYTVPCSDAGRLFIGVNDTKLDHPVVDATGGGVLQCLDQATGERIWQFPIPRFMEGTQAPFHFNHWRCGVCSTPALDDERLYIVGPRGDVLCFDRDGQADGDDGPFREELKYMGVPSDSDYELTSGDGDIIWRIDLIEDWGVVPHDVCGSSPALDGDLLYVCTSNGVDHTHGPVANPDAPSLVAVDRRTGRVVATDGAIAGERILHGTWSSPVVAEFNGKKTVLFGAGDGILYAFEPPTLGENTDTPPQTLRLRWKYDCCPVDYREKDGVVIPYSRFNRNRADGPSEIIATPTVSDDGKIYVAIGQSPNHGPGCGMLTCIDGATGKRVWESREVDRTTTDVALHDGLLFISDYTGRLQCLDADTGALIWRRELGAGVWCASPVVADGVVYISTERQVLWGFSADRTGDVLFESRARSVPITPHVDGDVMYLPTQRRLFAIELK